MVSYRPIKPLARCRPYGLDASEMPAQPLRQDDVSGPTAATPLHQAPETLARQSRPRRLLRSLVSGTWSEYASAFEGALLAALPWTVWTYPGLRKGIIAILGKRASYGSIQHWRSGRRDPPQWACDLLADYLRGRAAAMLAAADEVQAVGQGERRGVAATAARKAKRRAKAREV